MNASELSALLLLATAMSFSPGPNTTLSSALAANHGLRHAMPFIWAVPAGWGLVLLLCTAGVGALVVAQPALALAIKLFGVAYLLWLAFKLARSARLGEADARRLDVGFVQGIALQFVNIKAWMLALAIVAGWIAGRDDLLQRLAVVLPLMLCFAFFSNLAYALIGALLRNWLAQGRRLLCFNRVMAAVLVLTAVWMLQAKAGA
ncbi:LysE family translocator [Pseudorhodoferax soli]|uniref:Threonine/homoserine/homoserine lactone efflux protein n=1 Tax=Pseudorhodoferax soli TaxID=545864 RepID=A0A368Y6Z7_9BURK|nr:LysE family translocator [Pseudorhodoferax soli]RCW74577.1 threonine/homoserine/homoserine lactone efflux protein [Pseudorhodoferax soli]